MNDFDNKQICSYKDIDRFGFTCDVCGRKVNGCSIVNGMKFCAKCYQETFGKDNQQNEIQQLRQQLEEKDKEIERLKVFEKAYYFNQTQVSQESMDLLLQNAYQVHNETQLAIQELEKLKTITEWKFNSITNIVDYIDQQIKELKGE